MANPDKLTASEQRLLVVLSRSNGTKTISEIADELGQTKNSCQVAMSNVRRKVVAAGFKFPEPKKLARGGGGDSINLADFMESRG